MHSSAVQIIEEIYAPFSRRDVAAVFRRFDQQIEIVQTTALPWGGVYRGHEGARDFFSKLTQQINSTVSIERMIDAVEHVIVVGRTAGRVNATGATYDVPIAHVWNVEGELVKRVEFHIDTPRMLAALAKADERTGREQPPA